jgi:hypothetical protein
MRRFTLLIVVFVMAGVLMTPAVAVAAEISWANVPASSVRLHDIKAPSLEE